MWDKEYIVRLWNFFRNLKLGIKLNIVLVLAFGELLFLVVVVMTNSVGDLITQTGQQRVEQETVLIQSRFAEDGQDMLADARLLARTNGLIEAVENGDAIAAKTALAVGATPLDFDDIDLVNAAGVRFAGLMEEGDIYDIEQEDALLSRALWGGLETPGVIVEEKKDGGLEFRVAVALPLRSTTGDVVGGLVASRVVDDEFLKEINFARDDVHLALIRSGRILALHAMEESDAPAAMTAQTVGFGGILFDETAIARAMAGKVVIAPDLAYDTDGVPHALAYVPLTVGDDTQAAIGVLVGLGELHTFQRRLMITVVIVLVLLTLVTVAAVAFFGWKEISTPLHRLTDLAQAVSEGNLDVEAQIQSSDEIGMLTGAFNQMIARLREMLQNEREQAAELQRGVVEHERLQQEVIETQRQAIRELSTPIIPVMDTPDGSGGIIVVPLIGSIDTMRARDITRRLLVGIKEYRAKVVILDITGVSIVDSAVANHLNKTIQAARLKGAQVVVTGISDAVAETIVDLGIDWGGIETLSDLQAGLVVAFDRMGVRLVM